MELIAASINSGGTFRAIFFSARIHPSLGIQLRCDF
ncbi:hypothetical protein C6341_g8774 [Phytophthora cactorum]|nr:hypothetical protein C6341_g8774 [Phytophthora cactorum]